MTERPILFQGALVRAILDGSKTQTRRVLKQQPDEHGWQSLPGYQLRQRLMVTIEGKAAVKFEHEIPQNPQRDAATGWVLCPYGYTGDRLWVRETWAYHLHAMGSLADDDGPWVYAADGKQALQYRLCDRWRPSIHMPRYVSRLKLEITDVRVERLQDISNADAKAEGILPSYDAWRDYRTDPAINHPSAATPIESYRTLWESINGPDSWAANPWVWVVEFRRLP